MVEVRQRCLIRGNVDEQRFYLSGKHLRHAQLGGIKSPPDELCASYLNGYEGEFNGYITVLCISFLWRDRPTY